MLYIIIILHVVCAGVRPFSHDFDSSQWIPGFYDLYGSQIYDVLRYDVVGFQLLNQIRHELLENHRMEVFAQLVQNEPIADLAFVAKRGHLLTRGQATSNRQQHQTNVRYRHDDQTVRRVEQADQRDEQQPGPKGRVHILHEQVQWDYAHAVQLLDGNAGRAVFGERAFRVSGKYHVQGVRPTVQLRAGHREHVGRVPAAEEVVYEQHLNDRVGGVHQLAHEESDRVQVVRVHVGGEVLDEHLLAVGPVCVRGDRIVQVEHDRLDATGLPLSPHVSGRVEENRLDEKHEKQPLIRAVVLCSLHAVQVWHNAGGVYHVRADSVVHSSDHGGRRVRPAVRVEIGGRNPVQDAVHWIPEVLAHRYEKREYQQQYGRHPVVQFEHIVIDTHVTDGEEFFDGTEKVHRGRVYSRANAIFS